MSYIFKLHTIHCVSLFFVTVLLVQQRPYNKIFKMFIHLFQQTKSDYVLDDHYESARFTDYTPWKVI